ncbi:MAG: hypothetical protein GY841_16415 [FCB group bacterium]|nr:hypothetical protein [FCB group bacterium]
MPIRKHNKRLTDAIKIVCLKDDALDVVPAEIMTEYERFRDFDILVEPDEKLGWCGLNELPSKEQPTIFKALPLRPDCDYLAFKPDTDDMKEIFIKHVIGVENSDIPNRDFRDVDGRRELKRDALDDWIPSEWIYDVAMVISKKGADGNGPLFMTLGTWLGERLRRKHGRRVPTDKNADTTATVNEDTTKSEN